MRIRTIKPEFWESESLAKVSREARLLFVGLFNSSDDFGKSRASSRILASRLYPFDDDANDLIPAWLDELERAGCICRYTHECVEYLYIPKWSTHQRIDHPSKSKIPDFSEGLARNYESSRGIALEQGTGNREQGTGNREAAPLAQAPLAIEETQKRPAKKTETDEEWLAGLKSDPAYVGIDVSLEHAKATRWAKEHGKQMSRRRFVNWLNRCDRKTESAITPKLDPRFDQF